MEYDSKDEIKAVVALGIIAGILVYFQIIGSGGSILPNSKGPTDWGYVVNFAVYVEMFVFGTYLLFLTVSLGADSLKWSERSPRFLKDYADIFFGIGAIIAIPLAVSVWVYLYQQALNSTGVFYFFETAFVISIVVIFAFAIIYYSKHYRSR